MKDFKVLHPQYDDNLYQNWTLIRPSLIDLAKKKTGSGLKEILRNIENDGKLVISKSSKF